jgi:putative oxidoreductase
MKARFYLGRAILGGFFLYNGINHFRNLDQLASYAAMKKVPKPKLAVAASGALIAFGGASMILGVKPKWGSLAIMTFLAGVTPNIHDFWNDQEPQQKQNNMTHFMKNAALLGATVAVAGAEGRKDQISKYKGKDRERVFGRGRAAA